MPIESLCAGGSIISSCRPSGRHVSSSSTVPMVNVPGQIRTQAIPVLDRSAAPLALRTGVTSPCLRCTCSCSRNTVGASSVFVPANVTARASAAKSPLDTTAHGPGWLANWLQPAQRQSHQAAAPRPAYLCSAPHSTRGVGARGCSQSYAKQDLIGAARIQQPNGQLACLGVLLVRGGNDHQRALWPGAGRKAESAVPIARHATARCRCLRDCGTVLFCLPRPLHRNLRTFRHVEEHRNRAGAAERYMVRPYQRVPSPVWSGL